MDLANIFKLQDLPYNYIFIIMFKTIVVSSIIAIASANLNFLQSENVAVELTDAAWPTINVPFNF